MQDNTGDPDAESLRETPRAPSKQGQADLM